MAHQTAKGILEKIKLWFVLKWKWVVGALAGILALAVTFYKRDAFHKENFENLKKNTDKEKKVTSDAAEKLVEESEKISREAAIAKEEILAEKEKEEISLRKKKGEFLEESIESDTLAEDLAEELGVDFIKNE